VPWVPVRYWDHGSYRDGQNASAVGRIWSITALRLSLRASSNQPISSACCCSTVSPVFDGQSMLTTLESQNARSWCSGAFGSGAVVSAAVSVVAGAANADPPGTVAAAVAATLPAARAPNRRRLNPAEPRACAALSMPTVPSSRGCRVPPVEKFQP
jgi:hypothetical protein